MDVRVIIFITQFINQNTIIKMGKIKDAIKGLVGSNAPTPVEDKNRFYYMLQQM